MESGTQALDYVFDLSVNLIYSSCLINYLCNFVVDYVSISFWNWILPLCPD